MPSGMRCGHPAFLGFVSVLGVSLGALTATVGVRADDASDRAASAPAERTPQRAEPKSRTKEEPEDQETPWSRKTVGLGQLIEMGFVAQAAVVTIAEGPYTYLRATPISHQVAYAASAAIDVATLGYSLIRFHEFSDRRQLLVTGSLGYHNYTLFGGPPVPAWRTPGYAGFGLEYRVGMSDRWGAFFNGSYGFMQENQLNQVFVHRRYLGYEGGLYLEYPSPLGRGVELRPRVQFGAGVSYQDYEYGCDPYETDPNGCTLLETRMPDDDSDPYQEHLAFHFGGGPGVDLVFFGRWVLGTSLLLHIGPHTNLTEFSEDSPVVGSSGRIEARLLSGVLF